MPSTTATRLPSPTATTSFAPLRGLSVHTIELGLDDTSRPLVRQGITLASSRRLPTVVWLPSVPGRWPLVVFVHGYDVGPMVYARFLRQLASSGYVVAAPSFPLEDPSRGNGLDRGDLPNEAVDVSFVISALCAGSLADRIEPGEIAVVGHSDGADVALMVGYQLGLADNRVKAVVADAPDPITGTVIAAPTPLLLIQGSDDNVVPYSSSQEVFRQVTSPRYYLTLVGATHLPPIAGGTEWTPVLDEGVADFLDAEVAHRSPPSSLVGELGKSSLVRLAVAGGA